MFTDFRMPNDYFIQSSDHKQGFLNKMYKGIFGIMNKNQPAAKVITTKVILKDYFELVWLGI